MWLRLWLFGKKLGCHQLPERSFFWHGRQFPVCARCTGVYLGELLALPLHFAAGSCWRLDLAFCLLMLLDWSIQFFAIRRSTNLRRLCTGLLCGYGCMDIQLLLAGQLLHSLSV